VNIQIQLSMYRSEPHNLHHLKVVLMVQKMLFFLKYAIIYMIIRLKILYSSKLITYFKKNFLKHIQK
jgi:hypothetical protein